MCGCSAKIVSAKDLQSGVIGIPLNAVMNDDFPALLSWAWCINSVKVQEAFKSKAGLEISESEFPMIAKIHQNGNDVKGYKVNFLDVVNKINFTQAERDNASCPYNFTR